MSNWFQTIGCVLMFQGPPLPPPTPSLDLDPEVVHKYTDQFFAALRMASATPGPHSVRKLSLISVTILRFALASALVLFVSPARVALKRVLWGRFCTPFRHVLKVYMVRQSMSNQMSSALFLWILLGGTAQSKNPFIFYFEKKRVRLSKPQKSHKK